MGNIGPFEVVLVLLIALLVLGPKKLPEVSKSVGKGIREFKAALDAPPESEKAPETVAPKPAPVTTTPPVQDEHQPS